MTNIFLLVLQKSNNTTIILTEKQPSPYLSNTCVFFNFKTKH